jgi:hypothetical protein
MQKEIGLRKRLCRGHMDDASEKNHAIILSAQADRSR